MKLRDALELRLKWAYKRLGYQVVNRKGKVKMRTASGEYYVYPTTDGFGFTPCENPENIKWTVHTKRKIPKDITAPLYYLLALFEQPAEFHEKVKGIVTKRFERKDGFTSFARFVRERKKKQGKDAS